MELYGQCPVDMGHGRNGRTSLSSNSKLGVIREFMAAQTHRAWMLRRSTASLFHGRACLSWGANLAALCWKVCTSRYVAAFAYRHSNTERALRASIWELRCDLVLRRLSCALFKRQTFSVSRTATERFAPSCGRNFLPVRTFGYR